MKDNKIFTIGFNKTGTTSIHSLFLHAGLKSQQKHINWNLADFQCFSDGDHHKGKFKAYEQEYPDSTFILNTRPLLTWLKSRSKHCYDRKKSWGWPPDRKQYAQWINERTEHFNEVMNHFAETPDKLILCNIEKPGWEKFVLSIFGLEKTTKKQNHFRNRIPDQNIPADTLSLISEEIEAALKEQGADGDELIPKNPNIGLFRSHL